MSEDTTRMPTPMPDDDPETGEPIRALSELKQDTSPTFLDSIRKTIHRRTTATQFLSFSWQLPRIVLGELGSMLVQIVNAFSTRKEE
jgi:hypothetical protein